MILDQFLITADNGFITCSPKDQPKGLRRGYFFIKFDRALYDACIDKNDYRRKKA